MDAESQTENRLSAKLAAADRLRREADAWVLTLRHLTIAKSCASYGSQAKSYFDFCAFLGESPLPVRELTVMRYVALFSNARSAMQYVNALRWVCDSLGFPVDNAAYLQLDGRLQLVGPWHTRRLSQLIRGAMKSTAPVKRAPAIMWDLATRLVDHAWRMGDADHALVYVFASVFMLRVANELIPIEFDGTHSKIVESLDADGGAQIVIHFASRKNRQEGASVRRRCLCAGDPGSGRRPVMHLLCPVHAFAGWRRVRANRHGRVFPGLNYTSFVRVLRAHLRALAVPDADTFATHGFRRGTAQQMLREGSNLGEILAAGDWRSPVFLQYLERSQVVEASVLDMLIGKDVQVPDGRVDTYESSRNPDGSWRLNSEVPACRAAPKRPARRPRAEVDEEPRHVAPLAKCRAAPRHEQAAKKRRVLPPALVSKKITDFLAPARAARDGAAGPGPDDAAAAP